MTSRIDIAEIQKAALRSIPLTFRLTSLPREAHPLLDRILEVYLEELGQTGILEPLSYCLKELIANAQKANIKRLYFEEKGLDIASEADYDAGMEGFRHEASERLTHWVALLKEKGKVIGVTFQANRRSLSISVRNGTELTPREHARIYDRIARARAYHSFVEALAQPTDSTEGAGLGILILLQFLKRIGLGEEAFAIEAADGETVATLSIPKDKVQLEKISVLTQAIVRDVDSLPHFPERLLDLIRLTEEPRSTVAQIGGKIATDPTLTADLLKLVNSAHFMLPRRVKSILEAVKIVGMKGLRNLLYSYGAERILGEKYAEMKTLWDHSHRTAYYAFLIARSFRPKADILDDVYVTGILHDLGQIIVTYLHPEAMEQMERFCREKDIPTRILERFSFGLHHADIGALIVRKWNFPEQLVQGIRYHHDPLVAPQQYKDIVHCVYVANALCDIERGLLTFDQTEKTVLRQFGIDTQERCQAVMARLSASFQKRQASF
jgi:HD-like signal output (HDOD) protein